MGSQLTPYLNFNGNARQALEFYAEVFGGEPAITKFADLGMGETADADKVMHGQLSTDTGYLIYCSDAPSGMDIHPMAGFSVSLSGDDDALHGYWDKLSASGTITMPMAKQAWGDEFGMCVDGFGVPWMVNISAQQV